ncbi:MAG: hypothetical protein IKF58_13855 [Bacillus sp. (in: Bacteria)]|nr:hypothetical protein [Bacillus sp. (in: firmicutes)]
MTDSEIKKELKKYEKRIFSMHSSEAFEVKEQLEHFIEDNHVTPKQMMEFARSGAGETLYMLTSDD